jgi:CheY-like chemotaxis protein
VQLPIEDESMLESKSNISGRGTARAMKQRILVVEDHRDVADAFAMLLRAKGCDVWVAPDGEAAVEAAHRFQPDVAFVDIGLPKMDGYEVARLLRGAFSKERLLLVALTAYGQRDDVLRAQQAGFNHHLLKPAKFGDIQNLLETHQHARRGCHPRQK